MSATIPFINRLKLSRDYLLKKPKVSSIPVEYVIETSGVCNLKCTMCPVNILQLKDDRGIMERGVFETVINKIKDSNGFILLTGRGEPLLNPHFSDYVKICKKNNLRVGTSTNCTKLTTETAKKIIEAGLDHIIFPLEGTNKTDYEKIRIGANFEDVVKNINEFLSLKKQMRSKIYVSIQSLVSDNDKKFIKAYKQSIKELFPDNYGSINEIRFKPLIEYGKEGLHHTKPCLLLWRNIFVSYNGNIMCCFQDHKCTYILGNLVEQELEEIWNSEKMVYLRKMNCDPSAMNTLETCKNCRLKEEYSGFLPLFGSTIFGPYLSRRFFAFYERLFL